MDRGAWRAPVHGVAKSQTQLSIHKTHTHLLQLLKYLVLFLVSLLFSISCALSFMHSSIVGFISFFPFQCFLLIVYKLYTLFYVDLP